MNLAKIFGIFATTAMLYVLSVGPAIWLGEKYSFPANFRTNPKAFETFYGPVVWLAMNTPLGGPLGWYVQMWQPKFCGKGSTAD